MSPCCSIVAQLEVNDLPCEVYFKIFTKKCHLSIKKKENLKKLVNGYESNLTYRGF